MLAEESCRLAFRMFNSFTGTPSESLCCRRGRCKINSLGNNMFFLCLVARLLFLWDLRLFLFCVASFPILRVLSLLSLLFLCLRKLLVHGHGFGVVWLEDWFEAWLDHNAFPQWYAIMDLLYPRALHALQITSYLSLNGNSIQTSEFLFGLLKGQQTPVQQPLNVSSCDGLNFGRIFIALLSIWYLSSNGKIGHGTPHVGLGVPN